jgi:subtilisin family serine protease
MELKTQCAAIVGRLLAVAAIAAGIAAIAVAGAPSVAAAQADHHARRVSQRTHGALTPSTRAFGEQWDLLNSGQQSGTPGDDIDATRAWDIEPGGNAAVLVGFVDSGVDFDQPSLAKANLYTQTSADASACAGALYGCSFTGAAGTPSDENGHGTATAGEVFSAWSGESDYAGVAPNSTLIVARVLGASNSGTSAGEAAGLDYVADRGARVVNVSITGAQSAAVHEAIATHPETLFVAAAGNSTTNDDGASASYPCADPSANVICVAATDRNDTLASFSSYGANTVDLAAPGVGIPTLTREGSSNGFSGTSFAAPLVTGTAALAFAARPQATVAQVKQAILTSVDQRSSLSGKTVSGGRLDAARALEALTTELPAAPPASVAPPTLSGDTSSIDGELTTSAGAWSGLPSTTIAWQRCDEAGGHCQTVPGAGGAAYRLSDADRGARIRSEGLATNGAGTEIAFSAPSAPIGSTASAQSAATAAPSSAGAAAATTTSGGQPSTTAGGRAAASGATPGRQATPAQCTAPGVRLTAVGGSAGTAKRALTLAPRARTTVVLELAAARGTAAQRKAAKRTALVELLGGGVCAKRSIQLAV